MPREILMVRQKTSVSSSEWSLDVITSWLKLL